MSLRVLYHLHTRDQQMASLWTRMFANHNGQVEVSCSDIFAGAPAADAIVSPANSFGFMNGGIDMVYLERLGSHLQSRLQDKIREDKNGELLVGDAVIIGTADPNAAGGKVVSEASPKQGIRYLISAPTMRVPMRIDTTPNAFLAFRAVILAVQRHNSHQGADAIRSVLCPSLGTGTGMMPKPRCAYQMQMAFEMYELGLHPELVAPKELASADKFHCSLVEYTE